MTISPTAVPVRGFMLDVSRDRVPTRASLDFLTALLQRCGYNQFELYMEHTFAYSGEEDVWGKASPLTAEDMRWLDELCRSRGISLVANRNGLGHMERWLQAPGHAHRAECPEGFDAWGRHWPASTLAVKAENRELVARLYEELAATVSARRINIGMDEPWEFGEGASRELVEAAEPGQAYTDWVLEAAQPWLERGYRVEMWGDILAHHPEQAGRLGEGIDLVMWCYDSPTVLRAVQARGGDEPAADAGFEAACRPFVERGSALWVAPGTGVWNSVTGRLDCAVENILDAVRTAVRVGSGGLLMTSWGDNGHWEGYVHCLVPLVVAGFAAGDPGTAERLADPAELTRLVGEVLFDDAGHPGAELLVRVGRLHSLLETPIPNQTALWKALAGPTAVGEIVPVDVARVPAARAELARLRELAGRCGGAGWVQEILTSVALAEVALDRVEGADRPIDASLVARVRSHWLATSRPGGLQDSLGKLAGVELSGDSAGTGGSGEASDECAAVGHFSGLLPGWQPAPLGADEQPPA